MYTGGEMERGIRMDFDTEAEPSVKLAAEEGSSSGSTRTSLMRSSGRSASTAHTTTAVTMFILDAGVG